MIVAMPIITMINNPVRKPAIATTYGIARIPAPIVIPTKVAIASRECFFDIEYFVVEELYKVCWKKFKNRLKLKMGKPGFEPGSAGITQLKSSAKASSLQLTGASYFGR